MIQTTTKLVASFREWMKAWATAGLLYLHITGEPTPASRPRVGKFGTYYGKTYSKWRKHATTLCEAVEGVPTDRPVFVLIETVCTKPRTGKLSFPRGDFDNFTKGPLDVMTKAQKFWGDDNQVIGGATFKRYAAPGEQPGFYVEWFEIEGND